MSVDLFGAELIRLLDYMGCATFAATGALAAARRKHDIVTFLFFAGITAVGGGTLRDVLMDVPVFWLNQPAYLVICAVVATVVWLWGPAPERRLTWLLWLDAAGLSAYAVLGADKAYAAGMSALTAVLLGILTATFGGIVRDVLAGESSVLLRREVYVTAALLGAVAYVGQRVVLGFDAATAAPAALALGFAVRAGALVFGWTMPGFRR